MITRRPSPRPDRSWLAISLSLAVAACSGGGGGGPGLVPGPGPSPDPAPDPGPTEPPPNLGTFTLDDFNYTDPRPATFQPFTSAAKVLTRQQELLGLWGSEGTGSTGAGCRDDLLTGQNPLPTNVLSLLPAGFTALGAMAADLDGQRGDELVVLGLVPASPSLFRVYCLAATSGAQFTVRASYSAPALSFGQRAGWLDLADLDRDGRAEVLLGLEARDTNEFDADVRAQVLTFDPAANTFTSVFSATFVSYWNEDQHAGIQVVAGNFDVDPELELAVLYRPDQVASVVQMYDGPGASFAARGIAQGTGAIRRKMQRIEFDGTAGDELVVDNTRVFDVGGDGTLSQLANNTAYGGGDGDGTIAVADLDGDGRDECLGCAFPGQVRTWAAANTGWASAAVLQLALPFSNPQNLPYPRFCAAVTDDNGDGADEVWFAYRNGANVSAVRVAQGPGTPKTLSVGTPITLGPAGTGTLLAFALTGGDFDGENLVLRYDGTKFLSLADPIPIALLAAPPTKAGISQQYDASETAYGVSTGVEITSETTSTFGLTASLGYEAEVPGVFGSSAKAEFTLEVETTVGSTTSVTRTTTYTGSFDQDIVVFQGVLYRRYQYTIVSASRPLLIGQQVTIDEPVQSKVYKWTLPYYETIARTNSSLAAMLSSTKGNPATCQTRAQAQQKLQTTFGWLGNGVAVGQGNGSTTTEIEVSNANSTATQRTLGGGIEQGFKIGGVATSSFSLSLTFGSLYQVETSVGTTFTGVVGDIADPQDYQDWSYDYGLVVLQRGKAPDGASVPGVLPCTVIDYWVELTGAAW
ncbi:MAG: hypothetical protein WAT39_25170 [Planctomycetota bacterium]